jgi:phosphoribosylglycinamide formyltransferase 1
VINIAVFASGSGTNFESLVNYFQNHNHISIKLLLCNRKGAPVLERAARSGIESLVFTEDDLVNSSRVLEALTAHNIHFIVLAGFLLKIPKSILEAYPDGVINIHPALLPKFGGKGMYGKRVHEAVLSSGDRFSGITIHMVNEDYDKGSTVSQHTCEIMKDDTPHTLADRIHRLEHYWYPRVIEKLLIGDV